MNEDTLHLLSECAAGTDMAIRSLEDVLKNRPAGTGRNSIRLFAHSEMKRTI